MALRLPGSVFLEVESGFHFVFGLFGEYKVYIIICDARERQNVTKTKGIKLREKAFVG